MAEDRYRLEPLRDVRARDERAKRSQLATVVGDERELAVRLTHTRSRAEAARASLAAAIAARPASGRARELALADRFIARRRGELDAAEAELARAAAAHGEQLDAVDGARTSLARSRADRELIDRHFARWREQQDRLAERRDD